MTAAMIREIDHVVVLVDALDAASARFRELGFTVVPGGRHPRATHNALVCFRDGSYLELIAFWDTAATDHPFHRHLAAGPSLIAYALGVADLAETVAALRARGIAYGDPVAGARRRPDGAEVVWRMAFAADAERLGLPFLIEDVTDRALRVPDQGATAHANGARGIACLLVAVPDLAAAASAYAALLEPLSAAPPALAWEQVTATTGFRAGAQRVELGEPGGAGPAADHLVVHGAGPYAVVLRGPGGRAIHPREAAGARLRIAADDAGPPPTRGGQDRTGRAMEKQRRRETR